MFRTGPSREVRPKLVWRTWNSHNASWVAAFFTHDADRLMGDGPRVSGREAIAEWWARLTGLGFLGTAIFYIPQAEARNRAKRRTHLGVAADLPSAGRCCRGRLLAAGAVPQRWRSALLGTAEPHVR